MRQSRIYNHHHLDICFPIFLPYPAHPEQHLGDPSSLGPDETHPVLKLQDISFGLSFLCSNIMASSVQQREESHIPDSEDGMLFNQQTLGLSRHQLPPTVCLKMSPPLPPSRDGFNTKDQEEGGVASFQTWFFALSRKEQNDRVFWFLRNPVREQKQEAEQSVFTEGLPHTLRV